MRLGLLIVAFLAAFSAMAATEPLRKWRVGSWEVSQYQHYCIGSSPSLTSGATMLMFSMHSENELIAVLANPKWKMREKRTREVFVTIDHDYLGGFPTKAISSDMVGVKLPLHLMQGLQDGVRITMRFDRATLTFPLRHTRHGLEVLAKCFLGGTRTASANARPGKTSGDRPSSGSGMFVSHGGHVLTNEHVVRGCRFPTVIDYKGEKRRGEVIASDAMNDLALISTNAPVAAVASLGRNVRQGEWVAAFGFPLSQLLATTGTFSEGSVAATAGIRDDSRHLQITAPVQPGNSGGPLLDKFGNVVGVVNAQLSSKRMAAAGITPQNVNFAIKASVARSFLESRQIEPMEIGGDEPMAPEDVADHARQVSVLIQCGAD